MQKHLAFTHDAVIESPAVGEAWWVQNSPNPYCFAGFGLHDELGLPGRAGLFPMEALQAARLNPARSRKAGPSASILPGTGWVSLLGCKLQLRARDSVLLAFIPEATPPCLRGRFQP